MYGIKHNVCMCNLDKCWTKDTKRPKNPITISEELRAKNLGVRSKSRILYISPACNTISSVQFSCSFSLTLFDPMDCSMPGLPVHHQLPEFT